MTQQAHITSIEALQQFKTALIIYQDKATKVLDEISDEVARTHRWIQLDQRSHWKQQLKQRTKNLEEAKQTLLRVRMSSFRDTNSAELLAIKKAERSLAEARERMRMTKKWNMQFDNRVIPLTGHLSRLHNFLSGDMPKAIASLNQSIKILDEYMAITPPESHPAGNPS